MITKQQYEYKAHNRATGIRGYYCVGRKPVDSIFWQYWTGKAWSGFGKVYRKTQAYKLTDRFRQQQLKESL